jgi:alkylhydroperoxidase/carboxymuconolactone decarboxylase family protein YurZ
MARAKAMFVRIFGPDYGAALMYQLRGEAAEFNAIVMCRIGPEIWDLDDLDIRSKVLCAIAIFCVLNRAEIKFFIRAAIHHGVTRKQIEEVLLLAGLESGFPNAANAQRYVKEAYAEHAAFMTSLRRRAR